MPKLILDLDLTVFTNENDFLQVHSTHELSTSLETKLGNDYRFIWLINPTELSELIEIACVEYDGVIICTAGAWHESIRDVLADNLDLSEAASQRLRNCLFISTVTCKNNFPDSSLTDISHMTKSTRFAQYLANDKTLRSQNFVFVDDNWKHILSFSGSELVYPIYATTKEGEKDFYQKSINALAIAKENEKTNYHFLLNRYYSNLSKTHINSSAPLTPSCHTFFKHCSQEHSFDISSDLTEPYMIYAPENTKANNYSISNR